MMAFPGMIAEAARQAGMKTPPEPDGKWSPDEYPHFHVYCNVQLGRAIQWGEHWENAKVVAKLGPRKIKSVTLEQLIGLGLRYQS
jgi:hypothetical protein